MLKKQLRNFILLLIALFNFPLSHADQRGNQNDALYYFQNGKYHYEQNQLFEAIDYFQHARDNGINDNICYVYEIASWQLLEKSNKVSHNEATNSIMAIANEGYERFGIAQPLFLNIIITQYVEQRNFNECLKIVEQQISKTPNEPSIYAMKGWIKEQQGDDDEAIKEYLKATSFVNADAETLNRTARKLFNLGIVLWNETQDADLEQRNYIKENYWIKAKEIAERALKLEPSNSDSEFLLDSINYSLEM